MDQYEIKNICCIGAGYVGGPTMAVISDHCPQIEVTLVDIDESNRNDHISTLLDVLEKMIKSKEKIDSNGYLRNMIFEIIMSRFSFFNKLSTPPARFFADI